MDSSPQKQLLYRKLNFDGDSCQELISSPFSCQFIRSKSDAITNAILPFSINRSLSNSGPLLAQLSLSTSQKSVQMDQETDIKFDGVCECIHPSEEIEFVAGNSDSLEYSSVQEFALEHGNEDRLQVISAQTLVKYSNLNDEAERMRQEDQCTQQERLMLIDCRHSHEYNGGHIKGAHNIQNPHQVHQMLFESETSFQNKIIVFYCEFSQQRSPDIFRWIRETDRNKSNYPQLMYPNIYILGQGYKNFYEQYPELCLGNYTPMKMKEHEEIYKKEKRQLREWWREIKNRRCHLKRYTGRY